MIINEWLVQATQTLRARSVASADLDAEILLAHTVGHPRTWIHAHSTDQLDLRHQEIANARLDLRVDGVPIAYIIGHREFYGRRFYVSPATLIPRPESEQIIELLNDYLPNTTPLAIPIQKQLVDIGTGSGCLGITAKLEHPELSVTLLDTSKPALAVAKRNGSQYAVETTIIQSDLLGSYPYSPDIVIANLPYVDPDWHRSPELDYEPAEALFAHSGGLSLIERCFEELSVRMKPQAAAIFEADPRQWEAINMIAKKNGFKSSAVRDFAVLYIKT